MVENRSSLIGIIAILIGASSLGLGAFSIVNFQVVEGPQGPRGDDGQDGMDGLDGIDGVNGTDGKDALGGIVAGILEPKQKEIISGNVTIRTLIAGSENYTISILLNGTQEIGTFLPLIWNSDSVSNGWWNITIIATDVTTTNTSQDTVIVFSNNPVQTVVVKGGEHLNYLPTKVITIAGVGHSFLFYQGTGYLIVEVFVEAYNQGYYYSRTILAKLGYSFSGWFINVSEVKGPSSPYVDVWLWNFGDEPRLAHIGPVVYGKIYFTIRYIDML
jgi:hypothetical protein